MICAKKYIFFICYNEESDFDIFKLSQSLVYDFQAII